jgi:hypothetical protein
MRRILDRPRKRLRRKRKGSKRKRGRRRKTEVIEIWVSFCENIDDDNLLIFY